MGCFGLIVFCPFGACSFSTFYPGLAPLRQAQGRLWAAFCRRFAAALHLAQLFPANFLEANWGLVHPKRCASRILNGSLRSLDRRGICPHMSGSSFLQSLLEGVMGISAGFLPEFDLEMASARRTLERIPEDKDRKSVV